MSVRGFSNTPQAPGTKCTCDPVYDVCLQGISMFSGWGPVGLQTHWTRFRVVMVLEPAHVKPNWEMLAWKPSGKNEVNWGEFALRNLRMIHVHLSW